MIRVQTLSADAMQQTQPEDEPYAALVVMVPEEHFADEDDICLQAATHVCSCLERHLLQAGHQIEDWLRGGCAEDWGVYYESTFEGKTFQYMIMFFPDDRGPEQRLIAVQFHSKPRRTGLLRALFGKAPPFEAAPSLTDVMELVGRDFEEHRLLTKAEFDHEYM